MNRRHFLLGAASTAGAALLLRPIDQGTPHSAYFSALDQALKNRGQYLPSILVDMDVLDQNVETLQRELNPNTQLRIVAKSLPCPLLLDYLMTRANTRRLMVFHQPFITNIAKHFSDVDLLVGKPMPVAAAQAFYQSLPDNSNFDPETQLQWLIDSPARAEQYLQLAQQQKRKLQLNVELDVGLHRGGLSSLSQLDQIMTLVKQHPQHLAFSGFMGYDPHVVKLPRVIKSAQRAYAESQQVYSSFIEHLFTHYPEYKSQKLTFNGAGSPTLAMHKADTVCNELSAGSCLVKPRDFDIASLAEFKPAAYIATPVLKKQQGTELPGVENIADAFSWWDPNTQQTFFIYGGNWLADPSSPKGLQDNSLFGYSSNQHMLNGSDKVALEVDDFVFLRPRQSEFVFLQFGALLPFRSGLNSSVEQGTSAETRVQLSPQTWPILSQS